VADEDGAVAGDGTTAETAEGSESLIPETDRRFEMTGAASGTGTGETVTGMDHHAMDFGIGGHLHLLQEGEGDRHL
jgi:hypothetical protein